MRYVTLIILILFISSCSSVLTEQEMNENQLQITSDGFKLHLYKRSSVEIPSTKGQVFISLEDVIRHKAEITITNGTKIVLSEVVNSWSKEKFELNGKWYELECNYIANRLIKRDKCSFTIRITEPPLPL